MIADDHTIVRDGLAALLASDPGIKVVCGCGDGISAIAQAKAHRPDVLLLDLAMPGMNGLDVCSELQREDLDTAVLFLSMHADVRLAVQGIERGAMGYLVKGTATQCLREAIYAIVSGKRYISPEIAADVERELALGATDPYNLLTPRERQVLQLIGQGNSSSQIARMLNTSVSTIHVHRYNLMHKLHIEDPAALAKYAFSRAAIDVGTKIEPTAR